MLGKYLETQAPQLKGSQLCSVSEYTNSHLGRRRKEARIPTAMEPIRGGLVYTYPMSYSFTKPLP
jgi:hypothetical protein